MNKLAEVIYQQVGLHLSRRQLHALSIYERELIDWNTRFNLTAIRDTDEIRTKHFLDSLTCLLALRDTPCDRMIDVGTGAGFPGLVMKIAQPAMRLTLVESVGKKADFCRHMVNTLNLEFVEVIQDRAEALGQNPVHREQYDWAIARAVAVMPVLAEYLLPLVRVGGSVLAMKGENGPAETHAAEHAMRILGGQLKQLMPVHLPGVAEDRYLVVVQKVAATPTAYPRRVGIPSKRPLRT
ncbi:MAG: 16S rRNA (guanine(527)-N(7))-methyltransferase RsmG [Anaerolineales bacterium]|jgi:16S rRNA (guanine527-N7)-methyltransferase|nr:16S rRNA (guanine(527)-N(7))-methyltransferase RsmG [Anaerolineales bacterium]